MQNAVVEKPHFNLKPIDEKLLEKLAFLHCSYKEMASILEVSADTLKRRYADKIEQGRNKCKQKLRRMMLQEAFEKENWKMMIWLSKQMLGHSEKVEEIIEERKVAQVTVTQLKEIVGNDPFLKVIKANEIEKAMQNGRTDYRNKTLLARARKERAGSDNGDPCAPKETKRGDGESGDDREGT